MKNFSIVVLFHNNAYFENVVEALLNQRHKGDEIIIVNDHSDVVFLKKLDNYKLQNNVSVINSDLSGNRSRNRNLGAMASKNEYLLFVDGDIVLLEGCLDLMRSALDSGYVGAFGNIVQGGNTPEQMALLTGFDYMKFVSDRPTLEDFFKCDLAHDRRSKLVLHNIFHRTEWQYFYSGYCAATKDAYMRCGRYNETFEGWGAEDVEFGYRLSKTGDLKFVNTAYAYHIAHGRDLFSIMQNNKRNLYWFFYQHPYAEIETYLSFHLSDNITAAIDYIKNEVKTLNLSTEHRLISKRAISILPVSYDNPDGNVAYLDENDQIQKLALMGMTLPFNDDQFDKAVLSTDLFCYPEAIAIRILQECYRVAKEVRIYKDKRRERIRWKLSPDKILGAGRSGMDRTNYHAMDIGDFTFAEHADFYEITGGIATKMPHVRIFNLPDIYPRRASVVRKCILFDLTSGLSDEQIDKISKEHQLSVQGSFKIKNNITGNKIRLSELIPTEMHPLPITFAYIIDSSASVDMSDPWLNYKTRHDDMIYQM